MKNTENTLHKRQQRRRNIAAAKVQSRDARSNEPSVPLVETGQGSKPCNVEEIVDMLDDTNTGQSSDLRDSNQSNQETPITVKNDKERDAKEQPVNQANDPPEMLEDENPMARRRPGRDIKPVIRLGIDE